MVQHKSVHFHCHDAKEGKPMEKFQEPEGMTTIDLKNVHLFEEERQEEVPPVTITTKSTRKYIVKSLVIGIFILFGMITFIAIISPSDCRFSKSLSDIFRHSKNSSHDISAVELTKLISTFSEKMEQCKETQHVDDCCETLSELYDGFAMEGCNIDTIRSFVGHFDGNLTKSDVQIYPVKQSSNNTIDNFKYYNEQTDDYVDYDNNNFFDAEMKISDMMTPVIEDGALQLEGDNIAIILSNGKIFKKRTKFLKKRQIYNEPNYYPYPEYPNYGYYEQPPLDLNGQYQESYPTFHQLPLEDNNINVHQQYSENYAQQYYYPPQIENKKESYRTFPNHNLQIFHENPENKERKFQFVDSKPQQYSENYAQQYYYYPPQIESKEESYRTFPNHHLQIVHENPESKERKFQFVDSKPQQSTPTSEDNSKDNSLDPSRSALTPTQCVPYTPPLNYPYNPSPRYAELFPVNRNPFLINPTYPYSMNPGYFPMTQYQYNPFIVGQNNFPSSIQATTPSGQYFICSPVPAPTTNHLTSIPGVEVRHRSGLSLQDLVYDVKEPQSNKTRDSDLCPPGEVLCGDELKCVKEYKVCNNEVDCKDASDEVGCSCTDRVGPSRLCDGYYDCPNGEDEWNCFGCKKNTFSCDDWRKEKRATCIPMEQRCDGIVQCRTGKDEDDCSILSETFGKSLPMYKISNSAGYLYKNYKGEWYPACSNSEIWASNACEKETGTNILSPITRMVPTHNRHKGKYINALSSNEIELVDTCLPDFAVYVQCPSPVCGKRMMGKRPFRSEEMDDSNEDTESRFRDEVSKKLRMENGTIEGVLGDSRVVGGNPSRPAAWPWIVSVYRNGFFHCGGVIITDMWILTAAHCVDKFSKYYFEVEAGILRRLSYSPMQQTRFVTNVICHDAYDRAVLKNDLALIKIDAPLKFNRYIRPICLPSEMTAGRNYLSAPPPGTLCTAIGWGATFEHGPDPDHLREVEVPVLKHCKYPDDEDGQEICAGFVEGGRDACQGDSGGPFMCRNPNTPDQWYLAGIVSHGDGCARPNEPGVYTRVSLYLEWIFDNIRSTLLPLNIPLLRCPGYECKGTKKCLPKRSHCDKVVDCLMGDDERHCERSKMANLFEQAMRRMIMLSSSLPLEGVNKLGAAEDIAQQTTANTEWTTLITSEESPVASAARADAISAFKIENSDDQTEPGLFATESEFFTTESDNPEEQTTVIVETSTEFTANNHPSKEDLHHPTTIKPPNEFFKCTKMLQLIPFSRRCDKFLDCEDGTDEMNCTCVEYLRTFYQQGICDGTSDCADLSDEKDCHVRCTADEFHCRSSSTCVEGWKKCDSVRDCPHNEDEWDCFALTDANALLLDGDLRPHLNSKGIVSFYHNRTWTPLCFNSMYHESTLASEVCLSLGLEDYVNYRRVEVADVPLKIVTSVSGEEMDTNQIKENNACNGLYVRCSNRTVTGDRLQDVTSVASDLYALAWNVAVYVDGEYKCTGILLNLNWVLTSVNCFHKISKPQFHYITVLAGIGRSYMDVKGPHEQLRLVVHSTLVLYSDAVLLRTEKKFSFTRYVRPISLPTVNDAFKKYQRCVAIGRGPTHKMETVALRPIKNCTSGSRCFKRILPPKDDCTQKNPWSGVITCESKSLYPIAIFHEPLGICGFSQTSPFTTVWLLNKGITDIMDNSDKSTAFSAICNGFRCALGNCIESAKVCDGIEDCRNGEDELETVCEKRKRNMCTELNLKCSNGMCVPKTAYCDRKNDCGDNSDEPGVCNCFNYLRLTRPEKICDGIVNCEDRSDEKQCSNCTEKHFNCYESYQMCVSFEMVCDGEQDCPNGEDEKECISLRKLTTNTTNIEGEVVFRTSGVWHSGCFSNNMSTVELSKICHDLGFKNTTGVYIETSDRNTTIPAPVFRRFDIVWIHTIPRLRLALRSGRQSLIRFQNSKHCSKLFIKCTENK